VSLEFFYKIIERKGEGISLLLVLLCCQNFLTSFTCESWVPKLERVEALP
jgi:hypothetical protein